MSEDLSEGEKGDVVSDILVQGDNAKTRLPRINSVDAMEVWASQQKGKKLYIVLVRHDHNFTFLSFQCTDFCHDFPLLLQTCNVLYLFTCLSNASLVKRK